MLIYSKFVLSFVLVISFLFTVILTSKSIVNEKETGIKEAIKLMGVKSWIYWLSWFIKTLILLVVPIICIVVALKVKVPNKFSSPMAVLEKTDTVILTIFLLIYASNVITLTFLLSSLFKKANSAAAFSGIIFFATYLPSILIQYSYGLISHEYKILSAFVTNIWMSEAILLIGFHEINGVGLNWSNINEPIVFNDKLTFLECLIVGIFVNFFHLILFYYFEKVRPGNFGIASKWYFPIEPIIQKIMKSNNDDNISVELEDRQEILIESEENCKNPGIVLSNVTKTFKQFGKIKTAVKNFSLNIYQKNITVLLGHNGAGKSTAISMITGLTKATKGNILVNNHNIVTDTNLARKQIGYCSQHNLLFDELTVKEHLIFFSKLKDNYQPNEIESMLDQLRLTDKRNKLAKTLSGGMKRKLSVAIAFIGNSKIIILDEPTAGMFKRTNENF